MLVRIYSPSQRSGLQARTSGKLQLAVGGKKSMLSTRSTGGEELPAAFQLQLTETTKYNNKGSQESFFFVSPTWLSKKRDTFSTDFLSFIFLTQA